jgi:hypothetical protein
MTNFICIFLLFRQKFLSYGKDRSSWGILFDIEREREKNIAWIWRVAVFE